MIQQITRIPVQQKAQEQTVQPAEDKGNFETLMKKTVSKLNSKDDKQTEPVKQKEDDAKDSNQLADSSEASVEGTDISSLAAMFQQSIAPQLNIVQTQADGNLQLSVLQVAGAQTTVNSTAVNQINPLAGETSGQALSLQMNGSQPGAQANPSFAVANSGKDVSTAQQINPVISDTAPTLTVKDASLPTAIAAQPLQASQQSQTPAQIKRSTEPAIQSIVGAQQQAVEQTKQGVDSSLQSVLGTQQKAVVQTKQSVDSSSQSVIEAQLAVPATEEKISVPVQQGTNQNQNTSSFSDLFQTGNVVIKVSDASSNVAKATCNQVADKIAVNFKAGNPEFKMDLYPQNLGKVSVKLAMQSGVLTVEILASDPKTQSMLMANTSEIKSMLQNTVSQPVRVLEPAQDKQWYQQQDQQNQPQQQQQQQNQNERSYRNALDGDITTDDFLSVMQQLRQQAHSV